jgi:hypothetical protein
MNGTFNEPLRHDLASMLSSHQCRWIVRYVPMYLGRRSAGENLGSVQQSTTFAQADAGQDSFKHVLSSAGGP